MRAAVSIGANVFLTARRPASTCRDIGMLKAASPALYRFAEVGPSMMGRKRISSSDTLFGMSCAPGKQDLLVGTTLAEGKRAAGNDVL